MVGESAGRVGAERSGTGPLAGLRVIEVSSFVAAPLGGMTLRQLGADVIRVDPPGGSADRSRWPVTSSGASLYWAGLNKGKRSLVVDLRAEAGQRVVRDLVGACPAGTAVVLTNVVGREWLSYGALSAVCPDLIHVEVRGNSDGSAAVDYTVNASTGFPLVTGPEGWVGPVNHVLPAWDIACGLYAALGVSAASLRRAVTGYGESVRIALSDVALAMAGNLGFLAEAEVNGARRPRVGNHLYGSFARDFRCSDGGRVMVVALTARHWRDLVEATEIRGPVEALEKTLGVDFTVESQRYEFRDALAALIQRWFERRNVEQATEALRATSVLWAQYRTFGEVVEHLRTPEGASSIVSMVNQPGIGSHFAPGTPLVFSASSGEPEPAPMLGEHTVSILNRELGLSARQVAALRDAGVVVDAADEDRRRDRKGAH